MTSKVETTEPEERIIPDSGQRLCDALLRRPLEPSERSASRRGADRGRTHDAARHPVASRWCTDLVTASSAFASSVQATPGQVTPCFPSDGSIALIAEQSSSFTSLATSVTGGTAGIGTPFSGCTGGTGSGDDGIRLLGMSRATFSH